MTTNIKYYLNLDSFVKDCKETEKKYLLLVSQRCKFYISLLRNSKIEAYGAIFPEIIFDGKNYNDGLIAYELQENENIFLQKDMLNLTLTEQDFENTKSIITFVDALSANKQTYLDSLFEIIGANTTVMGGGAGEIPFNRKEVIFSNEGMFIDAAILLTKTDTLKVSNEHGWEVLKNELIATMSDKNVLKQIDYTDVSILYKSILEEDLDKKITSLDPYLLTYPIGLVNFDKQIYIRDIIESNSDGFNLSLPITQNSVICILKGKKQNLLNAAYLATKNAVEGCNHKQNLVFLFECINRRLLLSDKYEEEIEKVKQIIENRALIGAATLGEILSEDNININYYNNTCIVGAVC
ncbi:FIST C-terminal domain-containing protein [Arcobacter sp. CECT 8985]|uniref:FIST C-terminal domain-containing protein n=1 Tax=Arcobacter sp. CECT 8985 TaxID=1935424 RepID=UPI00100B6CDE|nr:FIST C-terminal domain-containing protein [Arcobacter sp. CECT 8985]RXJ88188.1 hypothetical protein CRU93_00905 [Arcobacter sp. CECT 8985]